MADRCLTDVALVIRDQLLDEKEVLRGLQDRADPVPNGPSVAFLDSVHRDERVPTRPVLFVNAVRTHQGVSLQASVVGPSRRLRDEGREEQEDGREELHAIYTFGAWPK